jgi:hypothetical protein
VTRADLRLLIMLAVRQAAEMPEPTKDAVWAIVCENRHVLAEHDLDEIVALIGGERVRRDPGAAAR